MIPTGDSLKHRFTARKPAKRSLSATDKRSADWARDKTQAVNANQSTRNVVMGSTRVAAIAGIRDAMTVTAMSSVVAPKKVAAS